MKRCLIYLLFLLLPTAVTAQEKYFVAIDAEDLQPFSVQMGDLQFASSEIGHLVIPQLIDSNYQLRINFPGRNLREQVFPITINSKDKGYLLRRQSGNNWILLNWQSRNQILSQTAGLFDNMARLDTNGVGSDAFARLMAAVVNDSAVLYTPVPKPEPVVRIVAPSQKSPDSTTEKVVVSAKRTDTSLVTLTEQPSVVSEKKTEQPLPDTSQRQVVARPEPESKKTEQPLAGRVLPDTAQRVEERLAPVIPEIKSLAEKWTSTTRELAYVVKDSANSIDTVRLVIDLAGEITADTGRISSPDSLVEVKMPVATGHAVWRPLPQADSVKAMTPTNDTAAVDKKQMLINSDCKNFATDLDMDKLRIKLLGESNLDERIQIARKTFRAKCFTTKQIRGLSELFVNDRTRYAFFDAAYPFVSDSYNFKTLIDLLSEEYFINRFKAMVRW